MKISATNMRKKDGSKLVNGYKLTLQKTEVDRLGMGEGTELVPRYEDGQIILIEANRIICDYASVEKLWCYKYRKVADNQYNKVYIRFKMPTEVAEEIIQYGNGVNRAIPLYMLETDKNGKTSIIWKDKKYPQDPDEL